MCVECSSASIPLCKCVHTRGTVDAWKSESGQLEMSGVASALFAGGLLPVPCMEKDSNHKSGEDSQESHQENKNERN